MCIGSEWSDMVALSLNSNQVNIQSCWCLLNSFLMCLLSPLKNNQVLFHQNAHFFSHLLLHYVNNCQCKWFVFGVIMDVFSGFIFGKLFVGVLILCVKIPNGFPEVKLGMGYICCLYCRNFKRRKVVEKILVQILVIWQRISYTNLIHSSVL